MKTYTINEKNHITVFASKKEAATASETPFDTFANQDELAELTADWPMQRLISLWNSIPGVSPVSKFTSRKVAIERLWKAIQGLDVTPVATQPEATTPQPEQKLEVVQAEEAPAVETPEDTPAIIEIPEPAAPVVAMAEVVAPEEVSTSQAGPDAGVQIPETAPITTEPPTRAKKSPKVPKAEAPKSDGAPREGSKTAQVVAMLQRENGATLAEIMERMGWQRHTVRGFMAGAMKRAGYTVESFKPEGGERTYRIGH
jgi:Protein of unknown function (DUF3489)